MPKVRIEYFETESVVSHYDDSYIIKNSDYHTDWCDVTDEQLALLRKNLHIIRYRDMRARLIVEPSVEQEEFVGNSIESILENIKKKEAELSEVIQKNLKKKAERAKKKEERARARLEKRLEEIKNKLGVS
jgi:predicted metal-dependent hydrolase